MRSLWSDTDRLFLVALLYAEISARGRMSRHTGTAKFGHP